VARPVRASQEASPKLKILGKLLERVRACWPRRRSQAMATQSLPIIARAAPPLRVNGLDILQAVLYSIMFCMRQCPPSYVDFQLKIEYR